MSSIWIYIIAITCVALFFILRSSDKKDPKLAEANKRRFVSDDSSEKNNKEERKEEDNSENDNEDDYITFTFSLAGSDDEDGDNNRKRSERDPLDEERVAHHYPFQPVQKEDSSINNSQVEQNPSDFSIDDYVDPEPTIKEEPKKGKYSLVLREYHETEDVLYEDERMSTLEIANTMAKGIFVTYTRYDEIHVYEGDKYIETLVTPFTYEFINKYEYTSPEYNKIVADLLVNESVLKWCNVIKHEVYCNCGFHTHIYLEEKELREEKRRNYIKSQLAPNMVYECKLTNNITFYLNIKRRIWEDSKGQKVIIPHEIPLFALRKVYIYDEYLTYDLDHQTLHTSQGLLNAYEAYEKWKKDFE